MSDTADPNGDGEEVAERGALEAVYRVEAPRLARYFRARFRGTDDAEDMVQEVFARLAGKSFGDLREPHAYLRRILRNFLIDRNRRARTRPAFVPLDDFDAAVAPEQSLAIELSEMREQYRAAVDALPPRTRQVFLLHRVSEVSVKAIAEELEISPRTVEWHLAEAIVKIGEALDRP